LFCQQIEGSCSLISNNFNNSLQPDDAVEYIYRGVVTPRPVLHPGGRTIVLMFRSGGHSSSFQVPICKVPHFFLFDLCSYMGTPIYGRKQEERWSDGAQHTRPKPVSRQHCIGLPSTDPIQPPGSLPVYICSKIIPCCFEIRKVGHWVRLVGRYGLGYPTTESLGLCHCKTSVLDKLGPPLGWRIVFHGRRYSNSQ
jgi:hypothetical protein